MGNICRNESVYKGKEYWINAFEKELKLHGYSFKTRKSYLWHLTQFLDFYGRDPSTINTQDIKGYLLYLIEEKETSKATWNQTISSIKLFVGKVLNQPLELEGIVRPRRDKKLPVVLSKEEVQEI